MNTFDVKKRCIFSYEDFLKDRKKAEDADHTEKGENDIVKKSMAGEVEGKNGYKTLSENEKSLAEVNLYWDDLSDSGKETFINSLGDSSDNANFKKDVLGNNIPIGLLCIGVSESLTESELFEKKFSKEKREELADKGYAMTDGSFPIESPEDLRNAIKAAGRAKDKEAAHKHIKKRAKALQMGHLIPKEWK